MSESKVSKAANFTAEQVAEMRTKYMAAVAAGLDYEGRTQVVEELANSMGKNKRSIVAKLSREGIYIKQAYVAKTGEKPLSRDNFADAIGQKLGLTEAEADSLTKANKGALAKLANALGIVLVSVEPQPDKVTVNTSEYPEAMV